MPSYCFITGYSPGWKQSASTKYWAIIGDLDFSSIWNDSEILIRDSYTLRNLYVRVSSNGAGITTVESYINNAVGNLFISIGTTLTGAFRDTVNSDNLVSGDEVCLKIIAAGNFCYFTTMGAEATTAINTTPILACTLPPKSTFAQSTSIYIPICGFISGTPTTEPATQYIFRVASTLSNFRVYISVNTLDSASTARTRKNTANGLQSFSIAAGLTGSFEDAANTDIIAPGDLVNFEMATGGSGAQSIRPTIFQVKSNSAGQQIGVASSNPSLVNANLTQYYTIQGNSKATGTEAVIQILAQFAFTAQNMFVRIKENTVNGVTAIKIRKNGGDGNMSVSINATTTGTFEDTENSDGFIATDSLNWQIITGGDAGSIKPSYIAFELAQPAAGWTGKISGVTNPAKIMGVPVANIAKVKGVA